VGRSPFRFYFKYTVTLPVIWWDTWRQHLELEALVAAHRFDAIVSDNRYAAWNDRVPSYLLAHGLRFIAPGRNHLLELGLEWFNALAFHHYRRILVPLDHTALDRQAGGSVTLSSTVGRGTCAQPLSVQAPVVTASSGNSLFLATRGNTRIQNVTASGATGTAWVDEGLEAVGEVAGQGLEQAGHLLERGGQGTGHVVAEAVPHVQDGLSARHAEGVQGDAEDGRIGLPNADAVVAGDHNPANERDNVEVGDHRPLHVARSIGDEAQR